MRDAQTLAGRTARFCLFALLLSLHVAARAGAPIIKLDNPDWFINLTEAGYSDIAADVEGGANMPLYFREYLSGEWGAALSYTLPPDGPVSGGEWLEPDFVFPDWTTNSTFVTTSGFGPPAGPNADGFPIFTTTIENGTFSVTQTYEFLHSVTGIAQGTAPASAGGPGAAVTSNPYVLKQTYSVTNITTEPLLGVELYQFLHGLNSTRAVFDDRDYGEASMCGGIPCSAYHHDTTMLANTRAFIDLDRPFEDAPGEPLRAINVDGLFGFAGIDDAFLESLLGLDEAGVEDAFAAIFVMLDPDTVADIARAEVYAINDDIISFHAREAPVPFGWETGRYGVEGMDSHVVGKPATGVHLSVEAASLSGVDEFDMGDKWVSGAQAYLLGDLAPDETATFDVLLSISTSQSVTAIPLPAGLPLLAMGLAGLIGAARRQPRTPGRR